MLRCPALGRRGGLSQRRATSVSGRALRPVHRASTRTRTAP